MSGPDAGALEPLGPLGELLGSLVARQEALEAEVAVLREASRPPLPMRAVDFVEWYRLELGFPAGRYPISYSTVMRWWDDRATNGAEAWGTQAPKKRSHLWVDAWALLRWRAAGNHTNRRRGYGHSRPRDGR